MKVQTTKLLLPCLVLGLLAGCSRQEKYPNRPITLTCPWAPGGGTDRVSRQIAFFLEQELGVPVNVINATGGQGVTGHARGLLARPDGYTLAMMTLELNMLHWRGLTDLDWQACEPLMSVNEDPAAIFVRSDSPFTTMTQLEEAVRLNPQKLKASGTAALGAWHLALAGWLLSIERLPADVIWIPSQGAAPSLHELMSGGIDIVCCSVPEARTQLDAGQIRCLGIMAEQRMTLPGLENYKTLREQGSDWTLLGWRGLALPRGTPVAIQQRLVTALRRIVKGEVERGGLTFPAYMDGEGFDRTWRETADFAAFLQQSDAAFGELLQRDEFKDVKSGPIGPYAFPLLAAGLGGCCLLALTLTGFNRSTELSADSVGETTMDVAPLSRAEWAAFLFVPVSVAMYALLAAEVGFIPVAAAILLTFALLLRSSLGVALPLALIASVVIYQLFTGLLRVPLPPGWLGW
ncbi:MAG: tripartite tricarboxylate transporter substrate-binding protein [Planctomycetaceae bacterium]